MKCPSCVSPGTRLSCRVIGEGNHSLFFVHGFAAAAVTWEELAPHFPQDQYRLYLLDLKGSGDSAKPDDGAYSPEDHARLLLEAIEGFGLRQVTIIGHSLGGGIALLAWHWAKATGRSALISHLVLIDAAAYRQPLPRTFRWLRTPFFGRVLLTVMPTRFMVKFNLNHVYHHSSQVTESRISRYTRCYRGKGTARALLETARQVDRIAKTYDHREVTIPTLIIWGRHDRIIFVNNGLRLNSEIAGSRLVVFECGHNPHEEEAARCAAAIVSFLEEPV